MSDLSSTTAAFSRETSGQIVQAGWGVTATIVGLGVAGLAWLFMRSYNSPGGRAIRRSRGI